MSRTYKDAPYLVKKERLGKPKKNPTESRIVSTSAERKIVAYFFSHEVKEMERFELEAREKGYDFKKHEITGNLKTSDVWDGTLSKSELLHEKKRHNPLIEYMSPERFGLQVEGSDYHIAPEYSRISSVYEKLRRWDLISFEDKTPFRLSKTNIFTVYQVSAILPNWLGKYERRIEGEEVVLKGEALIKANACSCSMCSYDEEVSGKTRERAIVSKAKNEFNSTGEIDHQTEDSF